jgi:hypothetical protein
MASPYRPLDYAHLHYAKMHNATERNAGNYEINITLGLRESAGQQLE